jgi:hypothetical protein
LVVTVIVVAMLAVVGVALMQSTGADRAASRSVANYARAQLAADSGAAMAQAMVAGTIARYPDSATVWQNIGGGAVNGTNNEATVLYVRAQTANTNLGASPAAFGPNVTVLAQPLVSRIGVNAESINTNPVPLTKIGSLLPYAINDQINVNLNATNNGSRTNPFVGARSSTNPGAPITAAQWIYISRYGGQTNATNPYIARYAFWAEDESFKVNVSVAADGERGANSLGLSAAEARIDGSWGSSTNAELNSANFARVTSDRQLLGGAFPTAATAAFPAEQIIYPRTVDELRFLTTAYSGGLDLSRGGARRYPLNQNTFAQGIDSIKRVVAAITNTNASPAFGQRFYMNTANADTAGFVGQLNTNDVTAQHAELYLLRLAANMKDMVDADGTPTIITGTNVDSSSLFDNKTYTDPSTAFAIEVDGGGTIGAPVISGLRLAAFGKENVPRLQEYAIHGRVNSMVPPGRNGANNPGGQFTITIDHYFEFWNMGTNDIDLSGYWIKVYDMPVCDLGGGSSSPDLTSPSRSVTLQVPAGTIPAGGVRVITTAPADDVNTGLAPTGVISANVSASERQFSGTTLNTLSTIKATNQANTVFSNAYVIKTVYRNGSVGSSVADFGSTMVMGNSKDGFIDSFVGLSISRANNAAAFDLDARSPERTDPKNQNVYYARAGSLMGNNSASWSNVSTTASGYGDPLAAVGDPRTLNEALEMLIYNPSSATPSRVEQSRFLDASLGDPATLPGSTTLGSPNANYVQPDKWPDASSISAGAANAAALVLNSSFRTIGDLGLVADPVRVKGDSTKIDRVRGGGRSLKIGQSEIFNAKITSFGNRSGLWDGDQLSASRARAAWRLADVFTTNTNTTNVFVSGLVNPNGALRDGGAAMRAVWYGLNMLSGPEGSPGTANKKINMNNIVAGTDTNFPSVISRLTNTNVVGVLNPFWERGELSEIGGSYGTDKFVTGAGAAAQVYDRSREEIVRRSIEMVTTRGSIFGLRHRPSPAGCLRNNKRAFHREDEADFRNPTRFISRLDQ